MQGLVRALAEHIVDELDRVLRDVGGKKMTECPRLPGAAVEGGKHLCMCFPPA